MLSGTDLPVGLDADHSSEDKIQGIAANNRNGISMKTIFVTKCPLCQSTETRYIYSTYDVQFSKSMLPFSLAICHECGLGYLKEIPADDSFYLFYPAENYPTHMNTLPNSNEYGFKKTLKEYIKRKLNKRSHDLLTRYFIKIIPAYWSLAISFPTGKKVLDIGCGAGWKLDRYKEFGWQTYGVDASNNAIINAQAKGHNALHGKFEEIDYADETFDLIQLSHVLEHFSDPSAIIAKVYKILKNNGALLIETPNLGSYLFSIFNIDFWQIDSPRHICLFNTRNLTELINNNGFEVVSIKTNNSPMGVYNTLRAKMYRLTGREPNKCYRVLFRAIKSISIILLPLIRKGSKGENIVVVAQKRRC